MMTMHQRLWMRQFTSRRQFSVSSLQRLPIRQALQHVVNGQDKVVVAGWVKSVRKHKSVGFVSINDGSCLAEMQLTLATDQDTAQKDANQQFLQDLTIGSSVLAEGTLQEVQGKTKRIELVPSRVEILGVCDSQAYPLQKKYQSLEFLRENLHLRPRTNTFGAVARVRNALSQGLHSYFQSNDFLQLHSPILTTNDCEGAGEQFRVIADTSEVTQANKGNAENTSGFFGKPTYLTVSGQLHAELYASALSKVYTFGPTFRAENSNTTRHLAEFWMVEPEMSFAGLPECMESAQQAVQHALKYTLDHCEADLAFFNRLYDKQLLERLNQVVSKEFAALTYTQAIAILQRAKQDFAHKPEWGMDLQTEHERYLAEKYVKGPVFVTDYPADIKAFYMRANESENKDRRTVAGMDLLVPKIGELIGGSVREERYDVLAAKMKRLGLLDESNPASLQWYLDLRRFGTVPHAGWGLGFERFVVFASGMENIRDVIPFPRAPGHCPF